MVDYLDIAAKMMEVNITELPHDLVKELNATNELIRRVNGGGVYNLGSLLRKLLRSICSYPTLSIDILYE